MERNRALALAERLKNRRILILGDVMLDRYLWGTVSRISPEAPVPVVEVLSETYRLGGAANVAQNVVSLEAVPVLVGVVGDDPAAAKLREVMESSGVGWQDLVIDRSRRTTRKTRIIAHSQQVVRADEETLKDLAGESLVRMREIISNELDSCAAVIISDYGKGALPAPVVKAALSAARTKGLPVCVDPQETRMSLYQGATVITPNSGQAGMGYGVKIADEESLREVGWGLQKRLGCEGVLITRGENGMTLFEASGQESHFPAMAKKVYDVTGAGDTVIGVFGVALAAGASLAEAAFLANHAAGIVVGELGTASVTRTQLVEALRA
jgi:rfaE bifunctional protein kinase chain/domain